MNNTCKINFLPLELNSKTKCFINYYNPEVEKWKERAKLFHILLWLQEMLSANKKEECECSFYYSYVFHTIFHAVIRQSYPPTFGMTTNKCPVVCERFTELRSGDTSSENTS